MAGRDRRRPGRAHPRHRARAAPRGRRTAGRRRTVTAGALMAAEIAEQPAALQRLLDDGVAAIADARERVRRFGPRFALFAARGTSDHAALYAKYLTEVRLA